MADKHPLPIGTLVQVTPCFDGKRPYRGIVRGYDLSHTKYHIGDEYLPGTFMKKGLSWAFLNEVKPITEDEQITYQTGECAACGRRFVLHRDGIVQGHDDPTLCDRLDFALGYVPPCKGATKPPVDGSVEEVKTGG